MFITIRAKLDQESFKFNIFWIDPSNSFLPFKLIIYVTFCLHY